MILIDTAVRKNQDILPVPHRSERRFEKVMERLIQASEECTRLMRTNAYCFGLMGTLVERTRAMGVYPPSVWRWMRFVEINHWRFLLDLGKPISTVDSMGMWEHYQAEKAIGAPIHSPFLRRTASDLARQAARFVTKEFVAGFHRANVVDDTGASFDVGDVLREMDQAQAEQTAEESDLQRALSPEQALEGFDPQTIATPSGKAISIKKTDRRVVN